MYLMHKPSGDLVEVLTVDRLFDPFQRDISGRFHAGDDGCIGCRNAGRRRIGGATRGEE